MPFARLPINSPNVGVLAAVLKEKIGPAPPLPGPAARTGRPREGLEVQLTDTAPLIVPYHRVYSAKKNNMWWLSLSREGKPIIGQSMDTPNFFVGAMLLHQLSAEAFLGTPQAPRRPTIDGVAGEVAITKADGAVTPRS